jgi:hypothetical protein
MPTVFVLITYEIILTCVATKCLRDLSTYTCHFLLMKPKQPIIKLNLALLMTIGILHRFILRCNHYCSMFVTISSLGDNRPFGTTFCGTLHTDISKSNETTSTHQIVRQLGHTKGSYFPQLRTPADQ